MDQVKNGLTLEGIDGGLQKNLLGGAQALLVAGSPAVSDRSIPATACGTGMVLQLVTPPAEQPGPTPYWDRAFAHWGQGLNDAVESDSGARRMGSKTEPTICGGGWPPLCDFQSGVCRCWRPTQGEQYGQVPLHEGFALTMTPNGYMLSDKAIKNQYGLRR